MKPFLFIFGVPLLCLVIALATGCNHGSNIPIGEEPDACFVADECVDDVISEFCTSERDIEDRIRAGKVDAYALGFEHGQTSCFEACENLCDGRMEVKIPVGHARHCDDEDSDSDRHEHDKGKGHRDHGNGKGRGHSK